MALDCGNLTRLDGLQDKATAAAVLVNIDHHEDNTAFGRHNLVDMFASSTSELAFRLVRDAGWKISPEAAKCFYTGLVTDTGRFQTPEHLFGSHAGRRRPGGTWRRARGSGQPRSTKRSLCPTSA